MSFEGSKAFILVTGASRGLGQAIAVEFAKKVSKQGSVFLLLARGENGLKETQRCVASVNPGIKVQVASMDFCKPNKTEYFNIIQTALKCTGKKPSDFDHAAIFHNAGMFAHPMVEDLDNVPYIINDYTINVASLMILNSQFFKIFNDNSTKKRTMVQTTSGVAKNPFPTCSVYGAAKASRDIFAKVFSMEHPNVNVMSYAPGVMNTALYREEFEKAGIDVDKHIRETTEAGIMLTANQSAERLYNLLQSKKYINGEHTDTYGDEADAKYNLLIKLSDRKLPVN